MDNAKYVMRNAKLCVGAAFGSPWANDIRPQSVEIGFSYNGHGSPCPYKWLLYNARCRVTACRDRDFGAKISERNSGFSTISRIYNA